PGAWLEAGNRGMCSIPPESGPPETGSKCRGSGQDPGSRFRAPLVGVSPLGAYRPLYRVVTMAGPVRSSGSQGLAATLLMFPVSTMPRVGKHARIVSAT